MSDPKGELEGMLGSVRHPKGSPDLWESRGVRSPTCESGDRLVFNQIICEVGGMSEGASEGSNMGPIWVCDKQQHFCKTSP